MSDQTPTLRSLVIQWILFAAFIAIATFLVHLRRLAPEDPLPPFDETQLEEHTYEPTR